MQRFLLLKYYTVSTIDCGIRRTRSPPPNDLGIWSLEHWKYKAEPFFRDPLNRHVNLGKQHDKTFSKKRSFELSSEKRSGILESMSS